MDEMNYQGKCFLCKRDIYEKNVSEVKILWDPKGHDGRPICTRCALVVKKRNPELLEAPIKKGKISKKSQGLDKWLKINHEEVSKIE